MLYLKIDEHVLHLSDTFDALRNTCLKHYQLDPVGFYTAPKLAWNAMLKKTKIYLESTSGNSLLEFFEQQMRGGISAVFHRYAEANIKYLTNSDKDKETFHVLYLDVKNL